MLTSLLQKNKQPLMFFANGVFITGIHLACYYGLYQIYKDLFTINLISFCVAFTVNYFSQLLIFSKKSSYYVLSKYFISQLVFQLINSVLLKIFSHVHLILILMCIQAYITYLVNKHCIFKN